MTDKDKYKVYTVSENASSIDFIFSKEKKAPLFIYFYDYNGSQGESVVQGRCKQVLYTHYSQTLQFVCHLSLSLSLTLWYGFGGKFKSPPDCNKAMRLLSTGAGADVAVNGGAGGGNPAKIK